MFNGSSGYATGNSFANVDSLTQDSFGLYLYNRLLTVTYIRDETLPL